MDQLKNNNAILLVNLVCVACVFSFQHPPRYNAFYDTGKFMLFKDAMSILQYFEEQRGSYPLEIDTALRAYHECFFAEDVPRSTGLRRPFIVVEGKNRLLRETIARMFADTLGAKYMSTPPRCMVQQIHTFSKRSLIRNAFFALSLYPSAFNARQLLSIGTPVVMNGYWSEQASYIIDKLYRRTRDLPPSGSWIYDHPRDLMMPDILFYLKEKEQPQSQYSVPQMPAWRTKMLQIYSNFKNVPVILIDLNEGVQAAVDKMYDKMRLTLGSDFDFSPAVQYDIPQI